MAYLWQDDPHRRPLMVMHRVRIGLIGLSCVFLLVALAAALLRMTGSDGVLNRNTTEVVTANDSAPTEPLAQLGVVPGNAPPAAAPSAGSPTPPTKR